MKIKKFNKGKIKLSEGSGITKNTNTSSIVLALAGYIVLFAGKLATFCDIVR